MKVTGVFRLGDNKRALGVSFASEPTDDELRVFHDSISSPSPVVEVAQGGGIRIVKPATPIDQSALIRELAGALEDVLKTRDAEARTCYSMRVATDNFSNPMPEVLAHQKAMVEASKATNAALSALSRVPEEYRG